MTKRSDNVIKIHTENMGTLNILVKCNKILKYQEMKLKTRKQTEGNLGRRSTVMYKAKINKIITLSRKKSLQK